MHAWEYFQSTPLGELVTGSAHQAHPSDVTASLGVRFAGKTILALHIALEKAATVRIGFDSEGHPHLTGIRDIRQRTSTELSSVLRGEAAACGAEWVLVVLATGWQVAIGERSARSDPTDRAPCFARHRLMFETPEIVMPRAQMDRVYTAVDHPLLDKSVVFSVRRRELEELFTEIHKCGLGIAGVRIAVAAQLEVWLASEGDAGLSRDLLVTDGLSALLLNTQQRDFVAPPGAVDSEQPRQAVQRPSAIDQDIARFVLANAGRSITYLGPDDLCATVKKHVPDAEIIRPPNHPVHDTQRVTLSAAVQHELNFEARDVRPALPRRWRRMLIGYAALSAALFVLAAVNFAYAVRSGYESYRMEKESAELEQAASAEHRDAVGLASDLADARALRAWVAGNFHAQQFCLGLLRDVPRGAAIDKLLVEMKDGQITLTFVILGDQEAQLASHRAIERAINDLKYKIGGEDMPVAAAASVHGVQYRLHIIVPDSAEVSS